MGTGFGSSHQSLVAARCMVFFLYRAALPWIHLCDLDLRLNSPQPLKGGGTAFGGLSGSKDTEVVKFRSHHVALPTKMNVHDSAFIGQSRAKSGELDPWQLLCDSSLSY